MFLSIRKRNSYGGNMFKKLKRWLGIGESLCRMEPCNESTLPLKSIPGKNQGMIDRPNYYFEFNIEGRKDLERLAQVTKCKTIILHTKTEAPYIGLIEIDAVFYPNDYMDQKRSERLDATEPERS